MDQKTVILKIGGSVITDKNAELAAKTEIINRLAEEIKKAIKVPVSAAGKIDLTLGEQVLEQGRAGHPMA